MPRVAVICHFNEERWHSIDLVAEMLLAQFAQLPSDQIEATRIQPEFRRVVSRPSLGRPQKLRDRVDRLFNRTILYPRYLRKLDGSYDVFHIVDHSYSQLVRGLDPQRTVITCHDLDAFRLILDPHATPRPIGLRPVAQLLLTSFQRARHVVCVSHTVRAEALRYGIVQEERSSVAHNGVHPSCSPDPNPAADQAAAALLPFPLSTPLLLHVGSTLRRKRIELLLRTFRSVTSQSVAKLIRVGGPLSPEQAQLADELGIRGDILELPFLDRDTLAAVYRRANMLLLTSDREGFGLPLAEAMACGCVVVCSDLPVLREVGGNSAEYVDSADPSVWSEGILKLLAEQLQSPESWARRVSQSIETASQFSWANTARDLLAVYKTIT
jgi:glycosyltransferase involved in cell wall biosynthesis